MTASPPPDSSQRRAPQPRGSYAPPVLTVGDYVVGAGVLVERKTYADFAMSLVDGRLFPQAAALARSPHRPVVLLEGPKPSRMPDVHPHALKGAIVSLAVMWRLPVVHARDPEDALWVLRCLADQIGRTEPGVPA
jgi:DNA excision repair protein ERCC-4